MPENQTFRLAFGFVVSHTAKPNPLWLRIVVCHASHREIKRPCRSATRELPYGIFDRLL